MTLPPGKYVRGALTARLCCRPSGNSESLLTYIGIKLSINREVPSSSNLEFRELGSGIDISHRACHRVASATSPTKAGNLQATSTSSYPDRPRLQLVCRNPQILMEPSIRVANLNTHCIFIARHALPSSYKVMRSSTRILQYADSGASSAREWPGVTCSLPTVGYNHL